MKVSMFGRPAARFLIPVALLALTALIPLMRNEVRAASTQTQSRTLTVLAGAGQDTVGADAFFPQNLKIRVGDTVIWRINSDEPHTVAFVNGSTPPGPLIPDAFGTPSDMAPAPNVPVPGQPGVTMTNPVRDYPNVESGSVYSGKTFISSGRLEMTGQFWGVPMRQTFSLVFDTPGVYSYICGLHNTSMNGTIEVTDRATDPVPSQAEIDAAARAEMELILGRVERARAQSNEPRNEPAANGATVWFVRAGNTDQGIDDRRAQLREFLPRNIVITAGDTVVWSSVALHNVFFGPTSVPPDWIVPETQQDGPPMLIRNPVIVNPSKPSGVYDPTQVFNSGLLNPPAPTGTAWALSFDTPGVFEYFCGVHQDLGMKATITVLPSS